MKVGVLALAAGRARRFGSDKRLARLPDGQYCIEAFLDQLAASELPLLVCLGPADSEVAELLSARGCPHVACRRAAEGMGGTLADGITHVPDWDGVLVALADMPWIAADTYRIVASQVAPGSICIPTYHGKRGHPVGFGSQFFELIAALTGDTGARDVVEKHSDLTRLVAVADPAIRRDVDVPGDLLDQGGLY